MSIKDQAVRLPASSATSPFGRLIEAGMKMPSRSIEQCLIEARNPDPNPYLGGNNATPEELEQMNMEMDFRDLMQEGKMASIDDARELITMIAAEKKPGGKNTRLAWVLKYENNAVIAKMMKEYKLSKEDAETLFKDTLTFMWLSDKYGKIMPTKVIDQCWHMFILFMMDYQKFCHKYFGRIVYHRPNRPEDKPDGGECLKRSKEIVDQHFGGNLPKNWQFVIARCSGTDGSTSCW